MTMKRMCWSRQKEKMMGKRQIDSFTDRAEN
jgi:hypothetical protein